METTEFINQLIKSRKLESETNEDWEIYELVEQEIYHQNKVRDLEVYFYGFDDITYGDSSISNYFETIFFSTQIGKQGNRYTEEKIIGNLIEYFEIFVPHGNAWLAYILDLILLHFSKNSFKIICESILKLTINRRKMLGNILRNSQKGMFIYDEKGRVEAEYNAIIELCES